MKIDFDPLRQELSSDLVEGLQERYRLDWPGRREDPQAIRMSKVLADFFGRDESFPFHPWGGFLRLSAQPR